MATTEQVVIVELCRSNSLGSRFREPSVVNWRTVTEAEAARLVAEPMTPNGFFWRFQPADKTGNL